MSSSYMRSFVISDSKTCDNCFKSTAASTWCMTLQNNVNFLSYHLWSMREELEKERVKCVWSPSVPAVSLQFVHQYHVQNRPHRLTHCCKVMRMDQSSAETKTIKRKVCERVRKCVWISNHMTPVPITTVTTRVSRTEVNQRSADLFLSFFSLTLFNLVSLLLCVCISLS